MTRGTIAATAALALLTGLTGPAGAQGPASRRAAGALVVVDDVGREVGPVIGQSGAFAVAALPAGGAVVPVEVAGDRILLGLARVLFTLPGCNGSAFLSPPQELAPTNGTTEAVTSSPGLFTGGAIGPGNLLLGPKGPPLTIQPQSRWDSVASPPACQDGPFIGDQDVFASEVLLDLAVFQPPFHLRRP